MLGLRTLQRERIPFDLGDGHVIHFRTKADFDIPELGMWGDIQQRLQSVNRGREKAAGDDKHAELSRKSQAASLDVIRLVLPDLPDATLRGLKPGQIDHLAALCINVAAGVYQGQAADEDTRQEIAEKYPELPSSFIETLSRSQAWLLVPPAGGDSPPNR